MMRCGDSYITTARSVSAISLCNVCRPFLCGRNPRNKNSVSVMPAIESAAVSADGPGIATIFVSGFSSRTCITTNPPGSEMPGVPASDTSATSFPSERIVTTSFALPRSVRAFKDINRVGISYFSHNRFVTRVSSQKMTFTSLRIRTARKVTSSRFPIGVPMT